MVEKSNNHVSYSLVTALVSVLALMGKSSHATVVTPISPIFQDPVSGNQYQLLSNADWQDSEAEAQSLGGYLATIANQEQQNFVFDLFGGYDGSQRILWIGLYDPSQDKNGGSHASNFVWASGAPVTYTNWNPGEPNDSGGDEFYVAMYYPNSSNPGSWNDWSTITTDPIGIPLYGVVEYVPEPASFATLAVAGALLLSRRGNGRARLFSGNS
jgi:hypothetical protein